LRPASPATTIASATQSTGKTPRGTPAGVEPALVVQFFGSKQHLFRAATMPSAQIRRALEAALGGDPDHAGERLAEMFVALLEDHDERTAIVARIRSAASEPAAAALVRETVGGALAEAAAELGGTSPRCARPSSPPSSWGW
jgi:AcrR family transcriptional regulator